MNEALFLLDLSLVGLAAWLYWQMLAGRAAGGLEALLGWGILFVALLAGPGVILGETGGLAWSGFLLAHGFLAAAALTLRGSRLRGDVVAAREWGRNLENRCRREPALLWVGTAAAAFVLVTGILATFAEPVVYDALTYRLSRIGQWLQDGRFTPFATNDPRQHYMPVVPDLLTAWLASWSSEGFRGVALIQWAAGGLMLAATAGLARQVGLGRAASVGAAMLAAGTASVAPQFTTTHTDLVVAGLAAAAFYLWRERAENREGSWVAGIGAGLALGAKGTIFYLGPTLLLWLGVIGGRRRVPVAAWRRTLVGAGVGFMLFAMPGLWRNWQNYGNPWGPAEFVALHHGTAGGHWLEKAVLNLKTSFVQVLEPNSQPPGLGSLTRLWGESMVERLPTHDDFSYGALDRQATLRTIYSRTEPDADATSFGVIPLVLFLIGTTAAIIRPGVGASEIRLWAAGVVIFFVFFHALQQWHPYGFRYFVLVAPWLAVVGAWGLHAFPPLARRIGWTVAALAGGAVACVVLARAHQAGWPAVARSERARSFYVYSQWREFVGELGMPSRPLQVMLPFNRPLAAFYRLPDPRTVMPRAESKRGQETAGDMLDRFGDGWLIVPAARFIGSEGRVAGRTWLLGGDPENPFSLAAYRRLGPGEPAGPIPYRRQATPTESGVRYEFLVRAGDDGRVVLRGRGGSSPSWTCRIVTPKKSERLEGLMGKFTHELDLLPGKVSEVIVVLERNDRTPAAAYPDLTVGP